jgi:hypothetical protein
MSEERESLGLVAYNYEPELTEEEMQNMTTETLAQALEIQICFYFKHDFWRLKMEINFLY